MRIYMITYYLLGSIFYVMYLLADFITRDVTFSPIVPSPRVATCSKVPLLNTAVSANPSNFNSTTTSL